MKSKEHFLTRFFQSRGGKVMKKNKARYMVMMLTFLLTLNLAAVGLAAKKVVAIIFQSDNI